MAPFRAHSTVAVTTAKGDIRLGEDVVELKARTAYGDITILRASPAASRGPSPPIGDG